MEEREGGVTAEGDMWPDSSFCSSRDCQLEEMSPSAAVVLHRTFGGNVPS